MAIAACILFVSLDSRMKRSDYSEFSCQFAFPKANYLQTSAFSCIFAGRMKKGGVMLKLKIERLLELRCLRTNRQKQRELRQVKMLSAEERIELELLDEMLDPSAKVA